MTLMVACKGQPGHCLMAPVLCLSALSTGLAECVHQDASLQWVSINLNLEVSAGLEVVVRWLAEDIRCFLPARAI